MLVYGLTGGIGSGKSTVTRILTEAGLTCFDADRLGHELLRAGRPEAATLQRLFPECLGVDGSIDRRSLARRVFTDPPSRHALEDLLHPAIQRLFLERLAVLPRPRPRAIVIEGAVLLESGTRFGLDGVIAVFARPEVRVERLRRRDQSSDAEIAARMRAQLPEWVKVQRADFLVDNSGEEAETRAQVLQVAQQIAQETGGLR